MASILDHPAARDHDIANRRAAAREDQMIGRLLRTGTRHVRVVRIEHHPIRPRAQVDDARRLADRLRALARSAAPEPRSDMRFGGIGEHRAPSLSQPRLVFHPAQLLGRADRRLTIGAHAEAPADLQEARGIEETVTEIRLGGDGDADDDRIQQALSDVYDDAVKGLASGGRISRATLAELVAGYKELDRIVVSLSEKTNLPEKQILALWEKRTKHVGTGFHLWNAYTPYFKDHEQDELGRTFGTWPPEGRHSCCFVHPLFMLFEQMTTMLLSAKNVILRSRKLIRMTTRTSYGSTMRCGSTPVAE